MFVCISFFLITILKHIVRTYYVHSYLHKYNVRVKRSTIVLHYISCCNVVWCSRFNLQTLIHTHTHTHVEVFICTHIQLRHETVLIFFHFRCCYFIYIAWFLPFVSLLLRCCYSIFFSFQFLCLA